MTQAITPLQQRTLRSESMIDIGITPIHDFDNNYFIKSQRTNKSYRTTPLTCTCQDYKQGFICKHILLLRKHLDKQEDTNTEKCPNCSSNNLKKNGTRACVSGKKQRWLCLDCSHSFVVQDIRENKASVEIVVLCMDKYMKGSSYRQIQNTLKQFHNLKVSQVSVMNWVKRYVQVISEYVKEFTPQVSDTWHTDEQFIKVKGNINYVWNCMDNETRFLLASNVTEKRTTANARTLFKQAKQTANKKASLIITDGSFSYIESVKKEFKTRANPKPHYRYVSLRQRDSNNNIIERYHGTFRQREKNMRCMKTLKGANMFNKGFQTYYNFIKPHMSLDNKTPAQASGIMLNSNWEDLMRESLNSIKLN